MIRIFDIIMSIILIIVLMPLMAVIYITIKITAIEESPIYVQERVGKNKKIFKLYKFRTMYTQSSEISHKEYIKKWIKENKPYTYDKNGKPIYKIIDDPRITPVGKILRKFHLDELPQLFNVLKGDMSLVGPRPAIPYELKYYDEKAMKRFNVLPGITGIWQSEGNIFLSFKDMIDMDLFYVENKSLILNIRIIIKTIFTILGFKTHWRLIK